MSKEVSKITPESLEVANCYLQYGNIRAVSDYLMIPESDVVATLSKADTKRYIDSVYLDLGYRNRSNIASVMDAMIESKLEEARESEIYTSKDLADLLQMAHKMRMDEIKAIGEYEKATAGAIRNQTNVQINESPYGQGNYGKLMEKLLKND